MDNHVPLNRLFSPVAKSQEEADMAEVLTVSTHIEPKTWDEMHREFRCVILAEAGAGKTEELRHRARLLAARGETAFFIRIEDIDTHFCGAFEIGEESLFQRWLQSTKEAWFFLDSVDEARLHSPEVLAKALRRFSKCINGGAHRAHIYLSGRPYAWRPNEDRKLLDELLFFPAPQKAHEEDAAAQLEPQSALTIYTMRPLDRERIRHFCLSRGASDIDSLLREIERAHLWSLAARPFDLEGILAKWKEHGSLGGRLELICHNIDKRLRDDHSTDRAQRQPLNLDRARDGARRLAAAVLLSGQAGISVPDKASENSGIDAESILDDWDPRDVRTLLERGIFDDVIYGAVRFRHRDVRELLAAQWFDELLKAGNSRRMVEALFFRVQYGEKIIAPRLRPILPWLILFDDAIRRRVMEFAPEIIVEGGDPSRLPLVVRQEILVDIVRRIAANEDDRSARDNAAIARIAGQDLSDDTLRLVEEYGNNDDAVFFLGRLVWLGEMKSCVPPLINIAADSTRGIYPRIASVRAVMTCGTGDQKQHLWRLLNGGDDQVPRELLAELLQHATPNLENVAPLVISLKKLPRYERYTATGLGRALNEFVERFPIVDNQEAVSELLDGFYRYLNQPPYVAERGCRVSEEYAWLIGTSLRLVERLVEERNHLALGQTAIAIMLTSAAWRSWGHGDVGTQQDRLHQLVPDWPELNDVLYWETIEQEMKVSSGDSNSSVKGDWSVPWFRHYWSFDLSSLARLLEYIRTRKHQHERLVALGTAFEVYAQAGRPADVLSGLQDAVAGDGTLEDELDDLLNPKVTEATRRRKKELTERVLREENRTAQRSKSRDVWIAELRSNPDRVRNPANVSPGELTRDQMWLLQEIGIGGSSTSHADGANWRALIPIFGDGVACAYCEATISHWRNYVPTLMSEGDARDNSVPYSLLFGLAGLEIEASEMPGFPKYLNESEVSHALRFLTWEINGFPNWLERMHDAFPESVNEAVVRELLWELENTGTNKPMHYILHNLAYHGPWLHESVAPLLLEWIEANPGRINPNRHYCLRVLINGGTDLARLAALAIREMAQTNDLDFSARWHALQVECDPANGIPEVEQWLSTLSAESATRAAQVFITTLVGVHSSDDFGLRIDRIHKVDHLKRLYLLMHQYIRANEDIDRAGRGVYSPELRDEAQEARDRLFSLLSAIPGRETHAVLKQLAREHPDVNCRPWMARRAYSRAEEDGDLEPWTTEQISSFNRQQVMNPLTHRQMFDLTVHRLLDLKEWLELGNDSPWQTWQRAESETEMRNLIAGWLSQQGRGQYTTAQEPELANKQRIDIWLHNPSLGPPVPVELKLLNKVWSGPALCERLRNQLAGDYMREQGASCGVMLLVSKDCNPSKRWMIAGQRVGLAELACALKSYWHGIADCYPGVEAIDVVVIDLSQRGHVSRS